MHRRLFGLLAVVGFSSAAPAQVVVQQFTYPIPDPPAGTSYWQQASTQLSTLAALGVWGVWHPVPTKGGSGAQSMGYDPYDLYDLGAKDQRGTVATRFGTKAQYLAYIATAHRVGLRVVADVVLNHTGGADYAEPNPIMARLGWDDIADDSALAPSLRPPGFFLGQDNLRSWTGFRPKGADNRPGTGRFARDARHFHPSAVHPDHDEPYHHPDFGSDYCFEADSGYVTRGLLSWCGWFQEQTGVDGFRLDAVKLIEPSFLADFMRTAQRRRTPFYLVSEFWDTNPALLGGFQQATNRRSKLFDFGLFYALKDLVTKPDFDLRTLLSRRLADRTRAVAFVSNHDVERFDPVPPNRRVLPYVLALTMDGQPSVFGADLFAATDPMLPEALRRLISLHNRYAVGAERVLLSEPDVLVYERSGRLLVFAGRPGDRRSVTVATGFRGVALQEIRIDGSVPAAPLRTSVDGKVTVTIPEAGYRLLAPAGRPPQDRFLRKRLPTRQITELADDLDTGRLGAAERTLPVVLAASESIVVRLSDLSGVGPVRLRALTPGGRTIAQVSSERGTDCVLRLRAAAAGTYRLIAEAPGTLTTGRWTVER
jgi:alpha-amylase